MTPHLITSPTGRRVASAEESTAYLRDCAARANADDERFGIDDTRHRRFLAYCQEFPVMCYETREPFRRTNEAARALRCTRQMISESLRSGIAIRGQYHIIRTVDPDRPHQFKTGKAVSVRNEATGDVYSSVADAARAMADDPVEVKSADMAIRRALYNGRVAFGATWVVAEDECCAVAREGAAA